MRIGEVGVVLEDLIVELDGVLIAPVIAFLACQSVQAILERLDFDLGTPCSLSFTTMNDTCSKL